MTGCAHIIVTVMYLYPIIYVLQILNLASNKSEIERKVHRAIGNYAERGLRSLAVAYQVAKLLVCYSMLVHVQNKTYLNSFVIQEVP